MPYRAAFVMFLLAALPAAAEEPARRTLTVSASGQVEATPDRVILPVQVESRDRSLAVAKQHNDRMTDRVLKIAAEYKISKEKVKTSGMYINPQYRWENNKQIMEGYVVSRSMQITLDVIDQVERLIAALTEAGIDQIHGMQFTLSDPDALESDARKLAVRKASAKAAELAAAAGVKLGKVLSIQQGGENGVPPPVIMAARAMEMQASAPPAPTPGSVTIDQQVSIVYELE